MRRKAAAVKYAGFMIRKRIYASEEITWQLDEPLGGRGNRKRKTNSALDVTKTSYGLFQYPASQRCDDTKKSDGSGWRVSPTSRARTNPNIPVSRPWPSPVCYFYSPHQFI